jgi:hypothetical protein
MIQFDPEVYAGDEVRTAYDIELGEYEMTEIYKKIKERLDSNLTKSIRIRVIGRLV